MGLVAHPSLVPGEAPYFTAVMRDVRERHEADKALRESEAQTRGAIEASLDAMFILRAVRSPEGAISDLKIADCNRQALLLARTRRADDRRSIASAIFREARKRGLLDVCARVVATGDAFTTEYRIHADDSPFSWVWLPDRSRRRRRRDHGARHHRAESVRRLASGTGARRRSHGRREPSRLSRRRRAGMPASDSRTSKRAARVHRRQRFQGNQRHARPRRGRRSAASDREGSARRVPRRRRHWPSRRRRVRGARAADELPRPTDESDKRGYDLLAHIEAGIRERIVYQLSKANAAARGTWADLRHYPQHRRRQRQWICPGSR